MVHRIHPVLHGMDAHHESWCSPDGRVVLLRDRGTRRWRAVVDNVLVTDAERLRGALTLADEGSPLTARSAHDLAERLAAQERVHVVFSLG